MRILLLNHEYPPMGGGSGIAMKYLAESLVKIGHNVLVLTVFDREQKYEEAGVQVWRFPIAIYSKEFMGLRSWLSFLRLAPQYLCHAALKFKPHAINSHFVFPAGYVVTRTKLCIPHIASVVGADIHDPTRKVSADSNLLIRWFTSQAVKRAAALTTPSNDLTHRTKKLFPDTYVKTIPWGVPELKGNGRSRSQLGLPEDSFVISTLCRLVKRKHLDILLDSVAQLQEKRISVVIMGDGPEKQALQKRAYRLKITGQIIFTGCINEQDKAAYLKNSDIFCLPSKHEGFGLVFIEAMSVGTPVITTNAGGQNDIIRDGREGFLIPVDDVKMLSDKIRMLYTDKTLLTKISENAFQQAQEFRPYVTAQAFSKLYKKVVKDSAHLL